MASYVTDGSEIRRKPTCDGAETLFKTHLAVLDPEKKAVWTAWHFPY